MEKPLYQHFQSAAQDYSQIDGPTLLITTEEGEVEYDEKELLKHNTVLKS